MHPRMEKIDKFCKEELQRHCRNIRLTIMDDNLQPSFYTYEEVLGFQRLKGYYCQFCFKYRKCIKGPGQFLTCVASFMFKDGEKREFYENYPLTDRELGKLSYEDLLGIFYFHNFTFLTMTDVSRRALRTRILQIVSEKSPYLLTT